MWDAMVEVSLFTLFTPLIADVPRPSDPNLRIHSRCIILPQQTSQLPPPSRFRRVYDHSNAVPLYDGGQEIV